MNRRMAHEHAALLGERCSHCAAAQTPLVELPDGGYLWSDEEPLHWTTAVYGVVGLLSFGVLLFFLVTSL